MRARIAVLASGRGSNLQAILDYLDSCSGAASYEVAAVLSNKADAPALDIARSRKISAAAFDAAADSSGANLLGLLRSSSIDIIALAGYLKKIPTPVVDAFAGRIVNVHPALLPLHGGAGMYGTRIHEAVLAAGDRETGVSVHLVDAEYDRGPLIAQWRVPVLDGDDVHTLSARVLAAEHVIFPRAIDVVAAIYVASRK